MENIIISVIGAIVSIVTCVMTNKTSNKIDKNHTEMNKALMSMMRNDIKDIYYRNKDNRTLKEYERQSLDYLVKGYEEMGGNSFVADIYQEMRKWSVER